MGHKFFISILLLVILLILFGYSCRNQLHIMSNNNKMNKENCNIWNDTVCLSGNFIKFEKIDSFYFLTYGNEWLKRELKYLYNCSAPAGIIPYLIWENSSFICLKRSCGSYCGKFLFLPLDTNTEILEVENVLAHDTLIII